MTTGHSVLESDILSINLCLNPQVKSSEAEMVTEVFTFRPWCQRPSHIVLKGWTDILQFFNFITFRARTLGFPGGSDGKKSACMQETKIQFLCQEYPLEKGIATHSSILACRISWAEKTGRLQSMGLQRVRHGWATNNCISTCFFWYTNYLLKSVVRVYGNARFQVYYLDILAWIHGDT